MKALLSVVGKVVWMVVTWGGLVVVWRVGWKEFDSVEPLVAW